MEHAGLKQQRRAFILKPSELTYQQEQEGQFELNFELPAGSYATAILREIAQLIRPEFKRL
jgi:tRNA pseudouridine13 synthase